MLELTSFRNKHKGKDIYVFGSGPSCNFIDPSFVDDKITVGTNQTWRKYNTNYVVRKEHNLLQETLNNFAGVTLVSMGNCGELGQIIKLDKFKNTDNLCIYKHPQNNCRKIDFKGFEQEDYLTVSYSTITTSIHFAYYLGAKNIFLVGVDHGTLDSKATFDGYYKDVKETAQKTWAGYKKWLKGLDKDTIAMKNKLHSLGVNVYSINPFINFNLEGHKYE